MSEEKKKIEFTDDQLAMLMASNKEGSFVKNAIAAKIKIKIYKGIMAFFSVAIVVGLSFILKSGDKEENDVETSLTPTKQEQGRSMEASPPVSTNNQITNLSSYDKGIIKTFEEKGWQFVKKNEDGTYIVIVENVKYLTDEEGNRMYVID